MYTASSASAWRDDIPGRQVAALYNNERYGGRLPTATKRAYAINPGFLDAKRNRAAALRKINSI